MCLCVDDKKGLQQRRAQSLKQLHLNKSFNEIDTKNDFLFVKLCQKVC